MPKYINIIKAYINAFLPPTIWATLIFFFSDQEVLPGFDINLIDFIFKKCAHMFVYAILYWLLFRGMQIIGKSKNQYKLWLLPLIISLIYAITDELHQSSIPGRQATIRDITYDMLGASIVMLTKIGYI